jgi:hypothetical protein
MGMTQTMNQPSSLGGFRILSGSIRFGDFIRFDHHNVTDNYRLQWWKVLEADDFQIIIQNAGGSTRVLTLSAIGRSMRVLLHPYSLKHNR